MKHGATLKFRVTDATGLDVEDHYTEWLRTRLADATKRLDSGDMQSYPTEAAKTLLRERLTARRSAIAASGT